MNEKYSHTTSLARPCRLIATLLLSILPGLVQSQSTLQQKPAPAATPAPKPPPTPTPTPIEIARQYLAKKDDASALPILRAFLQTSPQHADALEAQFLLGQIQARSKQVVEALSTFSALTLRHRGTEWAARAYEQCALLQEQRRSFHEAQKAREDLLRENPDSPVTMKIWMLIADDLYKSEKLAEAAEIYAKFEKKLSLDAKHKLETARSFKLASINPEALLDSADKMLTDSNTQSAINLYTVYLQKSPNSTRAGEVKTKLGWCYSLLNTPESLKQAEALWQAVILKGPANDQWVGESQWNMIQLLTGPKGKWEEAIKVCEVVGKNFPNSARGDQALFTRAWLYWTEKNWDKCRPAFDDYLRAYPEAINHPPIKKYGSVGIWV